MSGYQDHKICPHCGRNDLDPLAACTCPGANKPRATADHSQRIQDIKSRGQVALGIAQAAAEGPMKLAGGSTLVTGIEWLLSQLRASLEREKNLTEALKDAEARLTGEQERSLRLSYIAYPERMP